MATAIKTSDQRMCAFSSRSYDWQTHLQSFLEWTSFYLIESSHRAFLHCIAPAIFSWCSWSHDVIRFCVSQVLFIWTLSSDAIKKKKKSLLSNKPQKWRSAVTCTTCLGQHLRRTLWSMNACTILKMWSLSGGGSNITLWTLVRNIMLGVENHGNWCYSSSKLPSSLSR